MASNNPQRPPQQFSDQMIQSNPNAIAQQQQKFLLDRYWNYQRQMAETTFDFKKHEFPLSRIKKIMKADEDVQMVSPEAPVLLDKACEFFIQELTIKSWLHAEHGGRRTLRKDDIAEAINNETNYYDFLFDFHSNVHADPGAVASSSSVPVLPPAVQRWIRYGDEEEMDGEDQQMNDVDGAAN